MGKRSLPVYLSLAVLAGCGATFLDLRTTPQYGWLVFGPEAKVRALVGLDGQAVTIDPQADGRSTGKPQHFPKLADCKGATIEGADGKTSYVIRNVDILGLANPPRKVLVIDVETRGPRPFRQLGDVLLTADQQKAYEIHFDGALAVEVIPQKRIYDKPAPRPELRRGEKPTELFVTVGTFPAHKAGAVAVRTQDDQNRPTFPKDVVPVADVEFPPREPGGAPIKMRYALHKIC